MSTDLGPEQRKRITEATEDLAIAQREVERAMLELTAELPRAQKKIISEVLKIAFEKLSGARAKLEGLSSDDP